MDSQITIGIPTCARPDKVKACLDSVRRHVGLQHEIIVVDSGVTDESPALYETYSISRVFTFTEPMCPSAARELIARHADTAYLLYLDDDNEVTPGAVEAMYDYLEGNADVDIVAGGWTEYGRFRMLAQRFNFGMIQSYSLVIS